MSQNLPLVSCFKWILHFFNVERIRRFTSTFVAIYSATSYQFGFLSRRKILPLDILKLLVTTLRNHHESTTSLEWTNINNLTYIPNLCELVTT